MNTQEVPDKRTAIISYLTIIGTLIAFSMNSESHNKFAAFHIRQALGLFISFFGLGYIVGNLDNWGASAAFYIFYFVLWSYGFSGAIRKEAIPVPLIGNFFQKFFKGIK
jgi:uncharacterized membrane protein